MMIIPHLILRKDSKILLTRRAKTQKLWANHWHCVTGKIEEDETPKEAILREAYEEVGISLTDINLVTVISLVEKEYFDPSKKFYSLELFFLADLPAGQAPVNREPLKQDGIGWFSPTLLPTPIIPGVKFGIENFLANFNYAEFRNV